MNGIELSHDAMRELLASVALGTASPAESGAVRAHVLECAECRAELAAFEETTGLIGLGAAPAAPRSLGAVRARLLRRVAAERPTRRRSPGPLAWAAAAMVILALGALFLNTSRARTAAEVELSRIRSASDAEIARLRDSLAAQESTLAALIGPEVQVVELASTGPREPRGRMFWDRLAGRWTLIAHDLPTLGAGRTYQLWVITTAGERVSAGTFDPVDGSAIVQATYALPRDALGAIAVTEEPAGGMPQPTGSIVIAGSPG